MDNLGKRLVRSLLEHKETGVLSENRISRDDIYDDAGRAFDWTFSFLREHGKWPTVVAVEENCMIELPDDAEDITYVSDLVRRRSLGRGLETDLRSAAELLDSRQPDEALRIISEAGLRHRKKLATKHRVVSYRESGEDRVKTYEDLKTLSGYRGVETPWSNLNNVIQGWVDGTFNVITAMQNTGKTWFLVVNAIHALGLGKKVAFVTLEMTSNRIAKRLDAVNYQLPFRSLRDGDLDVPTEETWKQQIVRDSSGDGDILIADKQIVRSVDDATAFVLEHQPDIVFIDGGYRFQTTGKRGAWEQQLEIVRDLQISAEATGIPWIVSTQQGDANETGREKKRGPHMRAWSVRYGKEWVIDPDVVIGLYANEDLRLIKQLEIHCLKMRDNAGDSSGEFNIHWDTQKMNFLQVDEPEFGADFEEKPVEY